MATKVLKVHKEQLGKKENKEFLVLKVPKALQ
jgi:hypothetical protein